MTARDEFRRLNFFHGFFTTADDWNAGQHYHLEKRKLHNRALHMPGVVRAEGDELSVTAVGGLTVRIGSGTAVDGYGNEIYLATTTQLEIASNEPEIGGTERTAYIAIRFKTESDDYFENVEAESYSGYTRKAERPEITVFYVTDDQPPDNGEWNVKWMELARIKQPPGAGPIKAPEDPFNPDDNEIDRRFVMWAGSVLPPCLRACWTKWSRS